MKAQVQEPGRPVRVHPGKLKALTGRSKDDEPGVGDRLLPARRAAEHVPVPDAATRRPRRTATACGPGCTTSTSSAWTCWSWPPACRTPRRSRRSTRSRRCRRPSASSATRRSTRSPACSRTTGEFADQGVYGKRKGGWFTDMFAAGFEGEDLPADGALAVAAVARRADGEGPALRRRDGRARLLHPDRPQGAAAAEGPRRPALSRRSAGPTRSSAARSRRSPRGSRRTGFNLKDVVQGLGRFRLLPRRRAGHRARPTRSAGRSWTTSALVRMLAPEQVERKVGGGLRRAVGPAAATRWRCSTAASTRRK